jgi:predicted nucleotidyltransferase
MAMGLRGGDTDTGASSAGIDLGNRAGRVTFARHGACVVTESPRESCLEKSPLAEHLEAIRALCREYGVARLEVFGSLCTPEFDPERSDIDFLVEYPPDYDFGPWLTRYFALEETLAHQLGRKVDLVMTSALNNKWFRREANKTRMVVYDASQIAEVA